MYLKTQNFTLKLKKRTGQRRRVPEGPDLRIAQLGKQSKHIGHHVRIVYDLILTLLHKCLLIVKSFL